MKTCQKCGYKVNRSIHYCPRCGKLLPGEKEQVLVDTKEYQQVTKATDCVQYDAAEWKSITDFYNSHLQSGYAPQGKQLIARNELAQLRKSNIEYNEAAKKNGTHIIIPGRLVCRAVPKHKKAINHIGFIKFWKNFIDKDSQNDLWFWCMVIYMLIVLSHIICMVSLSAFLDFWSGLGVCAAIVFLLVIGYIYVGYKILDIK